MALRLVEFSAPETFEVGDDVFERHGIVARWTVRRADGEGTLERFLLNGDQAESFVEWVDESQGLSKERRAMILGVEAVIPPVEDGEENSGGEKEDATIGRISRDELYQDAKEATELTPTYYGLVALSTVVAIGGMLRDNTAVVIGAMVIAPLIGPNMGLALGTTLGDVTLLRRAVLASLSGLAIGLVISVGAGALLPVDPSVPELALRAAVDYPDLVLALAAGAAGAMSFTRGISASLIGVMVAVALLPPLVAVGLFVGAGRWGLVWSSGLLLLTNVVSVNLAAVCTFFLQGVRPMRWYEEERARKATRLAIILWVVALALLAGGIWLAGGAEVFEGSP
jgi:uncharacterized hydrophobic protein (TIGR00341 family)